MVCATSIRVLEQGRRFKSEYIISQLLMQVLPEIGIDAVAYQSKRMSDYYSYPQAVNLAIPVYGSELSSELRDKQDVYWDKSKEVLLTEPVFYNEFLNSISIKDREHKSPFMSYVNEIYWNNIYHNSVSFAGEIHAYTKTNFSKFDEYLLKQKYGEFS
ncbi:hypothetical protein [Clostridium tagluense]|uniref:hypothetical protein n=1 Tax=Clostridium tagluense TaxID=360422 RepID=UPI001CF35DAB|nr:hypothetical protein [Clostridium tagluense]MCB2300570.1 hypothetical protein [Clostridium tagluense]